MKKNLCLLGGSIFFCLVLLEIGLRLFFADVLYLKDHRDDMFWEKSTEFGWTKRANSTGYFSNGFYQGYIVNDADGNRLNSDAGTFVPGYKTILFIGDSTTVSLEVNNDQTVPALVEQKLRQQGLQVNVINLGVRGYGTDQSVRKAIHFAEKYGPVEIIYMYCDNDIADNNVIKNGYRKYGKGVYLQKEDGTFTPYNYPVPEYDYNFAGIVLLNREGRPVIHETLLPAKDYETRELGDKIKYYMKKYSYIRRAVSFIQDKMKMKARSHDIMPEIGAMDPFAMVRDGIDWDAGFSLAYMDGGRIRLEHKDYFEAQMRFLLNMLKENIGGLKRLHVVRFPSDNEMKQAEKNASANEELFNNLLGDGVIDSHIDLNRFLLNEKIDIRSLRAKADHHFSYVGNQWIADHIVDGIGFNQEWLR